MSRERGHVLWRTIFLIIVRINEFATHLSARSQSDSDAQQGTKGHEVESAL